MRRFGVFATLLLMAGCSYSIDTECTELVDKGKVFHAVIVDSDEGESRVYIDNKMRILWNANDYISLFEGTTRNKKYVFLGDDGDNAGDFDLYSSGFGSGNDLDRYYALYPYASTTKYIYGDAESVPDYIRYTMSATQNYKAGSIGANANVMVAVTQDLDDYDLSFRSVCSFLRLRLYGSEQSVGSITFSGNNGEILSGNMAITPVYGGAPTVRMMGSGTTLTLNCSGGVEIGTDSEGATEFWLVIPPLNFPNGFTITVNGFYGGSQTYNISSNLTFERNTYNTMTRELSISVDGPGVGVGGWGDGNSTGGSAQ